jgi:hypothetical protein
MGKEGGIALHEDRKDFSYHQGELKEEGKNLGRGEVLAIEILSVVTWALVIENLSVTIV